MSCGSTNRPEVLWIAELPHETQEERLRAVIAEGKDVMVVAGWLFIVLAAEIADSTCVTIVAPKCWCGRPITGEISAAMIAGLGVRQCLVNNDPAWPHDQLTSPEKEEHMRQAGVSPVARDTVRFCSV